MTSATRTPRKYDIPLPKEGYMSVLSTLGNLWCRPMASLTEGWRFSQPVYLWQYLAQLEQDALSFEH